MSGVHRSVNEMRQRQASQHTPHEYNNLCGFYYFVQIVLLLLNLHYHFYFCCYCCLVCHFDRFILLYFAYQVNRFGLHDRHDVRLCVAHEYHREDRWGWHLNYSLSFHLVLQVMWQNLIELVMEVEDGTLWSLSTSLDATVTHHLPFTLCCYYLYYHYHCSYCSSLRCYYCWRKIT